MEMVDICVVTYLRKTEMFTKGLEDALNILISTKQKISLVIFSDCIRNDLNLNINIPVTVINYSGTKYSRILYLLSLNKNFFMVSIDNDITVDKNEFLNFVNNSINQNVDIAWAKIGVCPSKNLISRLIMVDKILSHNYIRPLLWKINIGISIPGQCFILKSSTFSNKLPLIDTYLDDLELGMQVNKYKKEIIIYEYTQVIAFEKPKSTFNALLEQRKRWAAGYLSVLRANKNRYERICIFAHGFFYHGLWILNWLIFIITLKFSPIIFGIYICSECLFLANWKFQYFFDALLYIIIFPIFHLSWFLSFIRGKAYEDNV